MNDKFFLVLNGPATSGKSTVTSFFMKEDKIFHCKYDAIKWLISNYVSENEFYREIVKEMLFENMRIAVRSGFSIIVDGGFGDYREKYKQLAQENNYQYLSINFEPPFEVLKQRFLERVQSTQKDNTKIAVTTSEGFQRNYEWYQEKNKDPEGITIDSSQESPEEIYQKIMALLKNKSI